MPASPLDVVLVGHLSADQTAHGRVLGGTVAYAARTYAAFGWRVGVVTAAHPREPLLDGLRAYADVHVVASAYTTTFENIDTPQGRRQCAPSVATLIGADDIPHAWRATHLLHLAPLLGEFDAHVRATMPHSVALLTAQGLLRARDADGTVRLHPWDGGTPHTLATWLVFSAEDVAAQPTLVGPLARSAVHTVVTRAAEGGTYYAQGRPVYDYPTPTVTTVDPTGAGDVFAASLWVLLTLTRDVRAALRAAAVCGATAVTRHGWDGAPTPDEAAAARAAVPHHAL